MGQETTPEAYAAAKRFADLVLTTSTILLESGAHCNRIYRNVKRLAERGGYNLEIMFTYTGVSVTVIDRDNPEVIFSQNRRIKHLGVHFGVLSNTSKLTWKYYDNEISTEELTEELAEIQACPRYSHWTVRAFVGLACGCLCLLSGGNLINGFMTAIAAFCGLWLRQTMVGRKFNPMVAITCAAALTTIITGLGVVMQWGALPEVAVATAVLYLIPGVPLINCVVDIIEGYIPIGLARGVNGGFILICIALGMFISMNILKISNF